MPDVILLGDINIDISAVMPAYPTRGGEGVTTSVTFHTGGSIVSTSLALARMGVNSGILGRIGIDPLSGQALADLDEIGVDRSCLQIDKVVSTGLIYIVVNPDGERTMFSARGANVFTHPDKTWENYFSTARWYHFSGYALMAQPQQEAAVYALELARQNHCRVSLDPNPEPALRYGKQMRDLLAKLDVFFPNEQELMMLTDGKPFTEAVKDLLGTGLKSLVVKRGAKGCVIAYNDVYLELPAFEIKVQNTTGAGDSFNAGVVMGRMVGLSWPAAGILGNALGAIACSYQSGGVAKINPGQVVELLEKDMFNPQWNEWNWALEQVLAYLSAV